MNADRSRPRGRSSLPLVAWRSSRHSPTGRWHYWSSSSGARRKPFCVHARSPPLPPCCPWPGSIGSRQPYVRARSRPRTTGLTTTRPGRSAPAPPGHAQWPDTVGALLAEEEEESERLFEAALDMHAKATRPFERARTELAFGEFLRRARRPRDAREHLRAALDGFETLRAGLWAERARVELRASGQTARRRVADTRDQLTEQELQIAHFVARGLSNREVGAQLFLSPRTIAAHLRNIFRKLGISSRTELAHLQLESVGAAAGDAADAAVRPTPP